MRLRFAVPLFSVLFFAFAPAILAQTIPPNTAIPIHLNQSISSKDAAINQRVKAKVAEDVLVNGDVLVPKGASAAVFVEKVRPGGDSSKPPVLVLRLDAVTVNHRAYPVSARCVGAKPPENGGQKSASATTDGAGNPAFVDVSQNTAVPDANEINYPTATILSFRLETPLQIK